MCIIQIGQPSGVLFRRSMPRMPTGTSHSCAGLPSHHFAQELEVEGGPHFRASQAGAPVYKKRAVPPNSGQDLYSFQNLHFLFHRLFSILCPSQITCQGTYLNSKCLRPIQPPTMPLLDLLKGDDTVPINSLPFVISKLRLTFYRSSARHSSSPSSTTKRYATSTGQQTLAATRITAYLANSSSSNIYHRHTSAQDSVSYHTTTIRAYLDIFDTQMDQSKEH